MRVRKIKKTLIGRLWLFGREKNRLLFGRPWNAVITSRHKMEMKYSDKGTLVQRQRYPLPSRSLQYWPMNHCVWNTTLDVQCLKIFVFKNIFDNCFVTICHFWFENIFDYFCHFWFENMFDNCFVIICHLSPYLHKSCLISWQNWFMKHYKFVSWQSGGSTPRTPRRGFGPEPDQGCAPDRRASLLLYSLPRPAHHRMLAIIKVTQAANFNVLTG